MKFSTAALLVALPAVSAFCPASKPAFQTSLSAVVTGPQGKAASSFEEDLLLTLKIIQDHDKRSTTVSKEQFILQMKEAAAMKDTPAVDLSIPYDAPAALAYSKTDKSMAYADFKAKYEADAVADVIAKRKPAPVAAPAPAPAAVDLSIPYDAPAALAYSKTDKSTPYPDFKAKFEADAVADVIAKQKPKAATAPAAAPAPVVVDLSIPYDAPAALAYSKTDKSVSYPDFKAKFEADAVADVIAKQKPKAASAPAAAAPAAAATPAPVVVDLSIPYDAPAALAYSKSDKSMPYPDFKAKYEADAVADVIAKKKA